MKLYLSSFRLDNNPERLINLLSNNRKTAIITNAIDDASEQARKEGFEREIADLTSLGLKDIEEIDLRHYFGKKNLLKEKLDEYGLVWVRGGNTFTLRRAYEYSGFDEILRKKITDKDFVYGGYSAGICILTPTLKGLETVDNPNIVPPGYNSKINWDGLGFLPYSIAPHYRSDHPETELIEKEVAYLKEHNLPFKVMKDGDVIIEHLDKLL